MRIRLKLPIFFIGIMSIPIFLFGQLPTQEKLLNKALQALEKKEGEDVLKLTDEFLLLRQNQKAKIDTQTANAWWIKAKGLDAIDRINDADVAFKKAKGLLDSVGLSKRKEYATFCLEFADFYSRRQVHVNAENLAKQGLDLLKTLGDLAGYEKAKIYETAYYVYLRTGNLVATEQMVQDALNQYSKDSKDDLDDYYRNKIRLADVWVKRGKYKDAQPVFEECLPLLLRYASLDDPSYRQGLFHQALMLNETNQTDLALVKLTYLLTITVAAQPEYPEIVKCITDIYKRRGEFKSALELAEKSFFAYENTVNQYAEYYFRVYCNLLNLYYASGDSASAEKYFERISIDARRAFGENHPEYAKVLLEKGIFLMTIGRTGNGMTHLNKAAEIIIDRTGEKNLLYARALFWVGLGNMQVGRYAKAQPILLKAYGIFKEHYAVESPYYGQASDQMAELYLLTARYTEASKYLKDALTSALQRSNVAHNSELFFARFRWMRLMYEQNIYTSGDSVYDILQQTGERLQETDRLFWAEAIRMRGDALYQQAAYQKSLEYYDLAIELYNRLPHKAKLPDIYQRRNNIGYATTLNAKAKLMLTLGKVHTAEKLLLEGLDYLKAYKGEDNIEYASALSTMAEVDLLLGRYTNAELRSRRATDILRFVSGEFHPEYAHSISIQGNILRQMGRYNEAEALFKDAVRITKDKLGASNSETLMYMSGLADVYLAKDTPDKAKQILEEALKIYKSTPKLGKVPDGVLIRLAEASRQQKEFPQALSFLDECLKQVGTNLPVTAQIYFSKGQIGIDKLEFRSAVEWFEKCAQLQKGWLPANHPDLLATLFQKAFALWKSGNPTEAKPIFIETLDNLENNAWKFFSGLSEREKSRYWNTLQPYFRTFAYFVTDQYMVTPELAGTLLNYQLTTKAILLNHMVRLRARIKEADDPNLWELFNNWCDVREQLSLAYQLTPVDLTARNINLLKLENQANDLEKQLTQKVSWFSQYDQDKASDWKGLKAILKPGEAMMEMLRLPPMEGISDSVTYLAIIMTSQVQIPQLIRLPGGVDLEQKAFPAYQNLLRNKKEDLSSYTSFWAPLEASLSQVQTLFYSPEGVYIRINPETLFNPQYQKPLGDKLSLVRMVSLRDLPESHQPDLVSKPKPGTAFLMGAPDFYYSRDTAIRNLKREDLQDLPGARSEVQEINRLLIAQKWTTQIFTGIEATETNLKTVANPTVLHIATHGFFTELSPEKGGRTSWVPGEMKSLSTNPMMSSGLLFAGVAATLESKNKIATELDNSILTSFEAMNLELDKTELVVLSACETGLGTIIDGEGVYGLQRAFSVAGAKCIIMSLWKVSDAVTEELMLAFYKEWLGGKSKQVAFRDAVKAIRLKYPQPYFWGGFILLGT
jgi:CHAT domain-containing protein